MNQYKVAEGANTSCNFTYTGKIPTMTVFYLCETCINANLLTKNDAICQFCIDDHPKGHKLVEVEGKFYCKIGSGETNHFFGSPLIRTKNFYYKEPNPNTKKIKSSELVEIDERMGN